MKTLRDKKALNPSFVTYIVPFSYFDLSDLRLGCFYKDSLVDNVCCPYNQFCYR